MKRNAHRMIAKLAEDMAYLSYEQSAKGNNFYKAFPNAKAYVREVAPTLIEEAYRTLCKVLGDDDIPEKQKNEIYEAIMAHNAIPTGKNKSLGVYRH